MRADTDDSPLPANIYFPAIPAIAHAFHETIEAINLTVTVYLVFQGVSKSGLPHINAAETATDTQ